jgi:hypothetical protein
MVAAGIGGDDAGIDGKAFALTRPASMQARTTASKTCRRRSLSRKRPCRFLEKLE